MRKSKSKRQLATKWVNNQGFPTGSVFDPIGIRMQVVIAEAIVAHQELGRTVKRDLGSQLMATV